MNEGGTRWDWDWLVALNIIQTFTALACLTFLVLIYLNQG